MLGWNRACTYCPEPALGQWGNDDDAAIGASGILYTCYSHWDALKTESDRARGFDPRFMRVVPGGDIMRRGLFVEGTIRIGKRDPRIPPELITEGEINGSRSN